MNNPALLNETDKYLLELSDFKEPLDRYVFTAIYNLYINGAEKIHTSDIVNYLQNSFTAKDLIEKENGISFLQDCEQQSDISNFNYYYNKLKKVNLVQELQLSKNKIDEIYCEDILNDRYSEINEKFERLNTTDIVNSLKLNIANIENKYVLNKLTEESKANDGIVELLKELEEKPEVGCRLQGDIFNTVTRGCRRGKLYLRSMGSGFGKALPNYTKIPTPDGWKRVDEIKIGDYLFDRLGNPTKVLSIFPQKEKKKIYKIYFKSGRVAECCDEHLWSLYLNTSRRHSNRLETMTLRELIDNPKGLVDKSGAYHWSIPINLPVKYNKKQLPIDPYVMGLILGDGSFRYVSSQKGFFFSSQDNELPKRICEIMNYKLYKRNSLKNYNWSFELQDSEQNGHKNVWVEDILKDFPELWQAKSENKFIPDIYLRGDIEQRYSLLSGLLDTDGHADDRGRISYTTVSPYLKNNVIELCESLGMTVHVTEDHRDKYTLGVAYTLGIKASKEQKLKMFKLLRKKEIVKNYFYNRKRTERRDRDAIVKIEETNQYTNMTCFYVDNEEHLFLINNFICTHNTRSAVGDAAYLAYPIRYDTLLRQWVVTGSCEKVLYVMTEQDTDEIKTMLLAYLTGINEENFLYGNLNAEEKERTKIAVDIMNRYSDNMLFARIADPCSSVVKNLFRRYNLQYGVHNFFFDYIFSSPAMLAEYRDLKIREDVCLRMFTTTLKNLAVELDSFIMTSTQISNNDDDKGEFKDFRNIQGARAIANLVDFACIASKPTTENLLQLSSFKKAYNFDPNLVIDVFKNRRGKWTSIRIWSRQDLGTCRRQDLFVTTPDMKECSDFQIIDFQVEPQEEFVELAEQYNKQKDEIYDGFSTQEKDCEEQLTSDNPFVDSVFDDFEEAFGDVEEKKKRLKNVDMSDLL